MVKMKMKIKLLFIIGSLYMGGAETMLVDQILLLNRLVFDITLIVEGDRLDSLNEHRLAKLVEDKELRLLFLKERLEKKNLPWLLRKVALTIDRIKFVGKYVKDEKVDIIHTHLPVNHLLLNVKVKENMALFHTVHNEPQVLFGKKSQYMLTKYCIHKKGMKLIGLYAGMEEELNQFFHITNSTYIPNSIVLDRFRHAQIDKSVMLKELGIAENSYIVGHVGKFREQKNHSFIMDVFSHIKAKRSNAHLILVGTGELMTQIENKAKQLGLSDCVSFLGTRGDIPELLNVFDVLLFPSLFEGFPILLLEAQAAGLPCVISDRITDVAICSKYTVPLSLEAPLDDWCQAVLYPGENRLKIHDIEEYNMNSVINKLEELYTSSVHRG